MASSAANESAPNPVPKTRSPRARPKSPYRLSHENRVLLLALASGTVAVLIALMLLWTGDHEANTRWSLTLLLVVPWLSFAFAVRAAVVRPLQTLSNMESALREGDFSFRVRGARSGDALGELMLEINTLSDILREQRLGAMEATALLSAVMTEIDVAVFAFDGERKLRLVNRAGERLLNQKSERIAGKTAGELGLQECLQGESAQTLEKAFPGSAGRWGVRRSTFRQGGLPHELLVISDLSRTLREEERQAWQRLVRVLGHELNNSLAPICSIAQSLVELTKRTPRSPDWEDDLGRGLRVIADRSDALSRFMKDYARLTRLPRPQLRTVELSSLIQNAIRLETRMDVEQIASPEVQLHADPDQLQQLFINLIRNAVDAAQQTGGKVKVFWKRNGDTVLLSILDEGPGVANPANLFVPFFTTKPGGSGIGLILSRQIAEAHGGSLTLSNRHNAKGCEALVQIPLRAPSPIAG